MVVADTAKNAVLVALGDSITAGVGGKWNRGYPHHLHQSLQQQLPDLQLVNWGIPGLTIPRLTSALQKGKHLYATLAEATCVVMTIGGNDILKAMPKKVSEETPVFTATDRERIAEELERLLHTLLPLVTCPVYFGDLYNPFPQSKLAERLIGHFNAQLIHPLGERFPRVRVVRLSEVLLGQEHRAIQYYKSGTLRDLKRFWRHPIHPNNEGHAALAAAFYQAILADLLHRQASPAEQPLRKKKAAKPVQKSKRLAKTNPRSPKRPK